MGFRGFVWTVALIAVAAAAYSVYAPETAESAWPPAAGAYARKLHDLLPDAAKDKRPRPRRPRRKRPRRSLSRSLRSSAPIIRSISKASARCKPINTVTVRTRVDGQVVKIAFTKARWSRRATCSLRSIRGPFRRRSIRPKPRRRRTKPISPTPSSISSAIATLAKQSFATQQQLDTQSALVSQLIAQIASDAAAIDAAAVQLDYTTIRAPISGRAGFRLVDEGNLVAAAQQTAIVTIAQLQPITVIFTRAAGRSRARSMRPCGRRAAGAGAEFRRQRGSGQWQTDADRQSGRCERGLDPPQGGVREQGQCRSGRASPYRRGSTVGVAKNAGGRPGSGASSAARTDLFVCVVDDQSRVAMRPVVVSHEDVERAVVDKGVNEGERVVTVGQYVLQPGMRVAIDAADRAGS